MGGTCEFLYGCILLRSRHLPLLSCALKSGRRIAANIAKLPELLGRKD